MAPEPSLLQALAGGCNVAAQHCEHVAMLIRWAIERHGVSPAEGGEAMNRRAMQLGAAALACREAERALQALAQPQPIPHATGVATR